MYRTLRSLAVALLAVATVAAVAPATGASRLAPSPNCANLTGSRARPPSPVVASPTLRECLRINQLQVIGTHNSYKQPTTPEILAALRAFSPPLAESLEYHHPPLAEQFGRQEVRQIEIDVFADPEGGLYARRVGLGAVGLPNEPPDELFAPGYKTLHIQDLDFETSCLTLVDCLEQVKAWSDANDGHLPIAVLVELKQDPIPDPLNLGFTIPIPIDADLLDDLDAEIRSVFGEDEMITPDDVRGRHRTLESAVRAGKWPTVADAAGQVLFLHNNGGRIRDLYRAGRPSLEGRVLFTNSSPGAPDAAFVMVNDAIPNVDRIRDLVRRGYVVRTRSDVPTEEARSGDTTRRDAALASGAQWVSTDYPVPGSSPFSAYFAAIPGGDPARCNPVNTGPVCDATGLEAAGSGSQTSPVIDPNDGGAGGLERDG